MGEALTSEQNRKVVLNFYQKCLIEKQPRSAFEQFVSSEFVEHKPDVPDWRRDAVIQYLEGLISELPFALWEVVRCVAEDDFVVIHAKFTPSPGEAEYVIADFFRLVNSQIVEHWDVIGHPPRSQKNPQPRI